LKGEDKENFGKYIAFHKAGIWESAFFEKMVFVCTLPTKVLKNELGRLHSTREPAVQWINGESYYFINGIEFTKELWQKVHDKTITSKEALELKNAEQRTAILKEIGYDILFAELGGVKLDEVKAMTEEGKEVIYQLIEMNLGDEQQPARFQRLICHSTYKDYLLRVHPQCKTVKEALKWSYRPSWMTDEQFERWEYNPIKET
jgi:hypothetical protein